MALSNKIKGWLNNRMTIYRLKKVQDDFGGLTNGLEKVLWNLPCRIYNQSGAILNYSVEGTVYPVSDKLICSQDIEIKLGDKIVDANEKNTYLAIKVNMIYMKTNKSHLEVLLSRTEDLKE